MQRKQVVERYGLKPALVEYVLSEPRTQAIRDCLVALPLHFSHRNDVGPQGELARSAARSVISHLRLLKAS